MASRVRILSESLANKIAAGEVVERPASVAKELVENALDAGATDIRLEITSGGRRLIRISDNGHGMSREDALLALERHATSKLKTDSDLDAITTLGFRGEALPSIASVSRLRLKSREAGAPEGTEIYLEGGTVRSVTACGMATGTDISVEQLFFNTPARLKFLRSPETEAAHVGDLMVRMAIARPEVSFSYLSDGRELFRTIAGTTQQRLQQLVAKNTPLFPLSGETPAVKVSGFFASPAAGRSTTGAMFTYINGRFVRDKVVQHAIMQAFRPVLEKGRYPLLALFLELPSGEVDVNVHPTKHEVRFRRQSQVHDAIHSLLSEALSRSPWLKAVPSRPVQAQQPEPATITKPESATHHEGVQQALSRFMAAGKPQRPDEGQVREPLTRYENPRPPAADHPEETGYFSSLTVIGQFQAAYILCQSETSLVIIDQHAAAERVRFQQLRDSFLNHRIESQRLLLPDTLELSFAEADTARRHQQHLASLGIELDHFGGQTFMLAAVPALAAEANRARLVHDLLEELTSLGASTAFESVVDELLSRIACHGVIRGAHPLNRQQMQDLLRQMDRTDFAAHCPHGRPVSHELPLQEIERIFRRT